MEKNSSDNVTQISLDHAFAGSKPTGPAPKAEQMIASIREELTKKIGYLNKAMDGNPQAEVSAFKIERDKAQQQLQSFENILTHVPIGFKLTPVLYSKITPEQNNTVLKQYSGIRPKFMEYLAEHHADELAALGISAKGVERMASGHNPGASFPVNIDHIIERAGGGNASLKRDRDPERAGSGGAFIVNHFSNFILLPTVLHEMKNELNSLQETEKVAPGSSKWVLMMVPLPAAPGYSGYVSQPQPGMDLKGTPAKKRKKFNVSHPLHAASSAVKRASNILNNLYNDPEVIQFALEDTADCLTTAFNEATLTHKSVKLFGNFFYSKRMKELRDMLDELPEHKTEKLLDTFAAIDDTLIAKFAAKAEKTADSAAKPSAPMQPKIILPKRMSRKQRKIVRAKRHG